jgi:uncharacterized membrane protein HdeD (DUF308 family)
LIASVPLYGYLLALVGPVAAHFAAMFGETLLAPIKSGIGPFDETYNAWPWVPSVLCGLFAAAALGFQETGGTLFIICAVMAVLFIIIDILGVAFSVSAWTQKRR